MCQTGNICGFDYEKQSDGTFLYKAQETSVSSSKIIKPQYKEVPQYPLIPIYEQKAVQRYQKDVQQLTIDIIKFLNK